MIDYTILQYTMIHYTIPYHTILYYTILYHIYSIPYTLYVYHIYSILYTLYSILYNILDCTRLILYYEDVVAEVWVGGVHLGRSSGVNAGSIPLRRAIGLDLGSCFSHFGIIWTQWGVNLGSIPSRVGTEFGSVLVMLP